nr:isopropylmalate isomerase [Aquicoccus sp. G2-2]MEA1114027.1 isopropylmalate isomerase [Aquicoccus sp. G2-2]
MVLRDSVDPCICSGMTRIFDMDDRARLTERFFGEARSVLARL